MVMLPVPVVYVPFRLKSPLQVIALLLDLNVARAATVKVVPTDKVQLLAAFVCNVPVITFTEPVQMVFVPRLMVPVLFASKFL